MTQTPDPKQQLKQNKFTIPDSWKIKDFSRRASILGGTRGYGDSQYLGGITPDEKNTLDVKAANQGFWSELGNSLVQTIGGTGLQILEGAGYLGADYLLGKLTNSEAEFAGVLSDWAAKANETLKQEVVPVYNSENYSDVSEWFFENMPSIASAIALMVPAYGATKGITGTARLAGKGLSKVSKGKNLLQSAGIMEGSEAARLAGAGFDTISMSIFSRHAEGMMESREAYDRVYQEAISNGFSDDYAKKAAKQASDETYVKNWNLLATDLIQFGMLSNTFRAASRATKEATRKGMGSTLASLTTQAGIEAGEEAFQFIITEEAVRASTIKNKIREEDFKTYSDRMKDYVSNPDFWTSAFFGALGGAVFDFAGNKIANGQAKKQEELNKIIRSYGEDINKAIKGDVNGFIKSKDEVVLSGILQAIEQGRADQQEQLFNDLKEIAETKEDAAEKQEILDRAEYGLAQLKELEAYYNKIKPFNTPEVTRGLLVNRAEYSIRTKELNSRLKEVNNELLRLTEFNQLQADEAKLLEAYVEKRILENSLDFIKEQEKENKSANLVQVTENKIKKLQDTISLLEDTISTNTNSTKDQILDRISKPDISLFTSLMQDKLTTELSREGIINQFNNLATPEGKREYQKIVKEYRDKQKDKELSDLVNTIKPETSVAELTTLREAAKDAGKLLEFNEKYQEKLSEYKSTADKFDPTDIETSLNNRWSDNNLLKEVELNQIQNVLIKSGLAGENVTLDPPNIAALYLTNPKFREELNKVFEGNIVKVDITDINKQPTTDSTVDDNEIKNKDKENLNNKLNKRTFNAWVGNGIQFEYDTNTVEFKKDEQGNLIPDKYSKDINWEIVNTGAIPIGSTIHLEHNFNDLWLSENKDKVNANNVPINYVYYKDGNVDNKSASNRFIIGKLTAFAENREFSNKEQGNSLKLLREKLWNEIQNTKDKTAPIVLSVTTKLKGYKGGRIWNTSNTTPRQNPIKVLPQGQKLILGIGQFINGRPYINLNGHPLQDKVFPPTSVTPGMVYAILPDRSGSYIPVKLFTEKLEKFPELADSILPLFLELKENPTTERKKEILSGISNIVSVENAYYKNGTYYIELFKGRENGRKVVETITASDETLLNTINTLVVQVSLSNLNKTISGQNYNELIANQGYITSDLNPTQNFHSTQIEVEPIVEKVEPTKEKQSTPNPIKSTKGVKIKLGKPGKAKLTEENYYDKPLNETEIRNWFAKNLPQIPIDVINHLIQISKNGPYAWGMFKDAVITLYKAAPNKVAYHEAFHAVFNLFLTPQERESILNEASLETGIKRSFDTKQDINKFAVVDYTLKSIQILQSSKADEIFRKGDKNNWSVDKILNELQVPKEQQELIKSFNTRNREEIITSLLANYSYTVEINTAKEKPVGKRDDFGDFSFSINNILYEEIISGTGEPKYYATYVDGETVEISKSAFNFAKQELNQPPASTQYYSNLTVPGGTNYTENEIATPAITPSIKGHAQFSTDKGIGWFRSDDKAEGQKVISKQEQDALLAEARDIGSPEMLESILGKGTPTKTRRILELQSDLFQKGRDKELLAGRRLEPKGVIGKIRYEKGEETDNQFLQLLNKNNNWVTFFIKSIIQDSAKKGYEKVLFPSGNTASKVEGHETLEQFKKQKEDRIKELEESKTKEKYNFTDDYGQTHTVKTDLEKINNEINQLKQELERVETEGFAALKPIYNFYENTVANILKKQGYNPTLITDEYGNTWQQIILTDTQKNEIIRLSATDQSVYNTNDIKLEEWVADRFADYVQEQQENESNLGYNIRQFFRKLWETIKSIFSDNLTINTLFNKINSSYYSNFEINLPNTDPRFKVVEDPITASKRVKLIDYYFDQVLDNYRNENPEWSTLSDIALIKTINRSSKQKESIKDTLVKLYSEVYQGLIDVYNELPADDSRVASLKSLIDQFFEVDTNGEISAQKGYFGKALGELRYRGINPNISNEITDNSNESNSLIDDEQKAEFSEEETIEKSYEQVKLEVNPKDTLPYQVRKVLRKTERYTYNKETDTFEQGEAITDDLGFVTYAPFDEIDNYLRDKLSDIYDLDDMMITLKELQYKNPNLHGIITKLENDPQLANMFFSSYAGSYYPLTQIQRKFVPEMDGSVSTRFIVYNANRKNVVQLLVDEWNNNLITVGNNEITDKTGKIDTKLAQQVTNEYFDLVNEISKTKQLTDLQAVQLSNVLNKFGITIEPQVFLNEHQENIRLDLTPTENLRGFLDSRLGISTIISSISLGNNPYEGDTQESSAIKNVAKIVLRSQPNIHQDSSISIEGKQVYSYNQPTFITKKLMELKNPETLNRYASNWWFSKNKIVQELLEESNQDLRSEFRVSLFGGLRMSDYQAKEYYEMTEKLLTVSNINLFDNNSNRLYGFYRLPILSDSKLSPVVKFKKYSKEEVIDALYDLALAENERITRIANLGFEIENFSKNGKSYQFIDVLNDTDTDISNPTQTKQIISDWMNNKFQQEKGRLQRLGILDANENFKAANQGYSEFVTESFLGESGKQLLENWFYNHVLMSSNLIQLTSVDLAYYKNYDLFQKRNGQIFKFTQMINPKAVWKDGTATGEHFTGVYIKDIKVKSELAKSVKKILTDKGYSNDYITSILSKYEDTNHTDAQTYITIDRFKKIQIGLGQWTGLHEKAYKLVKKGVAWDDSYGIFFQVQKPFYFDHVDVGDFIVPVQHKNSEVVLLPNLTKGNPSLNSLLKFMEKEGVDTLLYNSAVKVGAYEVSTVEDIKKYINDPTKNKKPFVHTFNNKYWGIQQSVPLHHTDTTNLFGSQIRKLITQDLPDDIEILGIKGKENVFKVYQELLTSNLIDSYNNVASELGNIEQVQNILIEEIRRRNLGEDYENAVKIVTDQQGNKVFNIPLFDPIQSRRMQNLLNSILRNRIFKQKINGGSFALMSSFGLSSDLKVKIDDKTGRVEYMEVMLPAWTKDMFPRNPKGEIMIDQIPDELLYLFGYRIPTEGLYSMKRLKVVGFTPDLMGGVALLPAEITTIAGEDFDIDKMYVMIPNFEVKNGVLQKVKYDLTKLETKKIQPKLKGKMTFSYGSNKRTDIISNTTIEAIQKGERTATTRYENQGHIDYWKKANVGDIIEFEGAKGEKVLVEITKPLHKLVGSGKTAEVWSKLEGWSVDYFNTNVKPKLDQAWQLEYKLVDINKLNIGLSKEQRDNALIDIISEIWSHESSNDKILVPGGFPTLSRLKEEINERVKTVPELNESNNPIFPAADARFFNINTNGSNLIGLAANHNTNHAISQYSDLALNNGITITQDNKLYKNVKELNGIKTLDGKGYISRNIAEFLAAFVDNAKDPVANDLNINLFTFDTVALLVRLGFNLDTAIYFINQPIIRELVRKYDIADRRGSALSSIVSELERTVMEGTKEELPSYGRYALDKNKLQSGLRPSFYELNAEQLRDQIKVLYTFMELREDATNLANLVRLTKTDTNGMFKTMADNNYFIQSLKRISVSDSLQGVNSVLNIPLIKTSNQLLNKAQNELLSKYFPFNGSIFKEILNIAQDNKGELLTQEESNYLYNNFIHYYVSGFNYFDLNERKAFITKFPAKFNEYKKDKDINKYEVIKYLKYFKETNLIPIPRIEVASNASISPEQQQILKDSLESMLLSTDEKVSSAAKNIIKYSFYTTYFGFTPHGFSQFIPSIYLESILNSDELNYRDYLYKLMRDKDTTVYAYKFMQQIYRHQHTNNSLLQEFIREDVTNFTKPVKGVIPSILISEEKATKNRMFDANGQLSINFFRYKGPKGYNTYQYAGRTKAGELIFNVTENLGYDKYIIEFDITNPDFKSSIANNQLPDFPETSFYNIDDTTDKYFSLNTEKTKVENKQLEDTLKTWLSSLGVSVEAHDDLKNRLGLNEDIVAVADIYKKLILLSKNQADITDLSEEVGHFAEAYSRGTVFHNRLMELIEHTQTYKDTVEKYSEAYKGDSLKLKQEAIGKLIGEAIIKRDNEVRQKTNRTVLDFLQALWNKFISIFKKANVNDIQQELNKITGSIASQILSNDVSSFTAPKNIKLGDKFYALGDRFNVNNEVKTLEDAVESIYKKAEFYKNRATSTFLEREKNVLNKIVDDFNNKNYELGLMRYIANANIELADVANRYNKIKDIPETQEEKLELIKTLKRAQSYVDGFAGTLEDIATLKPFTLSRANTVAAELFTLTKELKQDYLRKSRDLIYEFFKPYNTNQDLDLKKAILELDKDLSYAQKTLNALAEAGNDDILKIFDKIVKDLNEQYRLDTIEAAKKVTDIQKKLESAGVRSTNFAYERDFDGNLTGYLLSEINWGEYNKRKNKFFSQERTKKEIRIWFEQNEETRPDVEQYKENKKKELIDQFGQRLGIDKYNTWLSDNTIEVFDMESRQHHIKYVKELARPKLSIYGSQQYQAVKNNPAMLEYLNSMKAMLDTYEKYTPEIYRLKGLVPQIRKDFYERLAGVDADGRVRLKSAKDTLREGRETISEFFVRKEDEVDFGLLDEKGNPINFVPVFFTRRLENMQDLSLDLSSSILAYVNSVNNFRGMNQVVELAEVTKDIVSERDVLTEKINPVTYFNKINGKRGEVIKISGERSKAYERIVDYINMVVYGQQKKNEKILGLDAGKLADTLNRYTSISTLALNAYAGTANVLFGEAMILMESFAGEVIDNKGLRWAANTYKNELPKVLNDIGKRTVESKLNLWAERMNTLQDYNRELRDADIGRDNKFKKLFTTSSLYFVNRSGEHFMQLQTSLALAHRTKVKDITTGKEINLYDAFDVITVPGQSPRLKLKDNLVKVGNDNSIFKKKEDGQKLTERDITRFIGRQNWLNKRLHGIYNDIDKSSIQQYAVGRLAIMYRKFIKPGWNRRFERLTYNHEGEIYTQGYYTSLKDFVIGLVKDLKEGQVLAGRAWNDLNDTQKRNMYRVFTEVSFMLATAALAAWLTSVVDEDDDDNWVLAFIAYQAFRVHSELQFYVNPQEGWRILKSPAASIYQTEKLFKLIPVWNYGDVYDRGKYKGLTKFEVNLIETIPLTKTYFNFRTPEEQLKFFSNNPPLMISLNNVIYE